MILEGAQADAKGCRKGREIWGEGSEGVVLEFERWWHLFRQIRGKGAPCRGKSMRKWSDRQ